MAKREKCTQFNSKQIIAYCIKKYGADDALTKETIAAHNSNAHKKPFKRVVVKKVVKIKTTLVAANDNVKAAVTTSNVVKLPKHPLARRIALKRNRAAKRVNNIINAQNSFAKKAPVRSKPAFDPANIKVVNRHRRVIGLKWLSEEQYVSWFARYQTTANALKIAA